MASLFQVPTPIVGLMGRRRGQQPDQTILSQLLAQGGGPSIEQVMAMQQQAPQQMDRAAQDQAALGGDNPRERVSGWRVLDRVLGGQTVTEGLDTERARLQQIANQPNAMARNRQILESIQDPRERALFLADPEEWAKNVGQQFAPQVVGPGGVQAIGGRGVVGSPTYFESGDTLVERDPLSRTVAPVWTRTAPSIAEQNTMERNAIDREQGVRTNEIAQGNLGVAQERLGLDRSTAGVTLGAGQTRFDAQGNPVASVSPAPRNRPAQALEVENRISSINTDVTPTLGRMRQLLESGDVITGFGAEARLNAERALASAGNDDARRRVAATEEYRNTAARLRVGMAKSLGANPSNADLTILEQVTGGNIGQNRDSLLATITQGEGMASRQLEAAQQQLRQFDGGRQQTAPASTTGVSREAAIAEARRRGLIP